MNILEHFRALLIRTFEICFRFHKRTLLVASIVFLGVLSFFRPLDVHVTVDDLMNKENPEAKAYFKLKKDFNLHTNAVLLFEKLSGRPFSGDELCEIKRWVIEQGLESSYIQDTYSPLFLRDSHLDVSPNGFRRLLFPLIVPLPCDGRAVIDNPLAELNKTPWEGLLSHSAGTDFSHEYQVGDQKDKTFVMEKIVPLIEGLKTSAASLPRSLKVHWLGDASYQAEMVKGIFFNNALNGLVVVFVILAFRLFLGTWISGVIYLGTLIFSCVFVFGLMSLFHVPMDILNSSLFLFLAVSSIGDFIFLSQHELEFGASGRSYEETFKSIITAGFFTSFTTFIGFVSLCTSDVEIVSRLGLWVGISGMLEWVVTFLLMPCVMKLFLKDRSWVSSERSLSLNLLPALQKFSLPRGLCYALLSAYLIVPFCFFRLNVSDSPMELFRKSNPFRESVSYLFNSKGFKGEVSLVFSALGDETINRRILANLRAHPNVARIDDPYELLDFYAKKLSTEEAELMRKSLRETPQFRRYFAPDSVRAVVYLKEAELRDLYAMKNEVKAKFCRHGECALTGLLIAYAEFSENVSRTLLSSFTLSFTLVVGILILLAGFTNNFRYLFALLTSSMWGACAVLIVLAAFQIKINFVTSLVVAILVGMNGDNTIQFILSDNGKDVYEGVKNRAGGSILTTLLLMASSTVFLFHYFEPPVTFGLVLMFGFGASLLGDLWILKGLLPKKRPLVKN